MTHAAVLVVTHPVSGWVDVTVELDDEPTVIVRTGDPDEAERISGVLTRAINEAYEAGRADARRFCT
ncbi:MAG TPA: hypothetical protein VIX41_03585 [Acidimicrobiales bacterium]